MGLGVTIFAGILFGLICGIVIALIFLTIKTWWAKRKAFKDNKEMLSEIKSKQEVKDGTRKKENRRSEGDTSDGYSGEDVSGRGEPSIDQPATSTSDEDSSIKRHGIQIPDSGFTLRD